MQATPVAGTASTLGEGSLWWQDHLLWIDIHQHKVWVTDPVAGSHGCLQLNQFVGTVVPRAAGGLAVALHHGFYLLDTESGAVTPVADPEPELNTRFNDGKCDPQGRFWAGTMPLGGGEPIGSLYMLDADGTTHHRLGGIGCSNGICWSHDGQTMYYIDTPTHRLDAFDFEASTGAISNRRQVAAFEAGKGSPDGMTIDAAGNLWVALWDGGGVVCIEASTGKQLARVDVDASRVTSCAFGGPGLRQLYITTASFGKPDEPLAGSLFVAEDVGVAGVPAFAYAG